MLKDGTNIISSTNFRNNIKNYLEDIDEEQGPVFLTINGEGSHVIMHINAYDELRRYIDSRSSGQNTTISQVALIEGSKIPFKKEIYDSLTKTYQEEWENYTPEQLEDMRKSIEAENLWLENWAECINAKQRAYNRVAPEDKQIGK